MAAKKKVVAKKPAAKPATKKTATKAAPAKAAPTKAKVATYGDPLSKAQLTAKLAESTGLTKKQVNDVLDDLNDVIAGHLKNRGGAGSFTLPGLFKITTKHKPATKARKGTNPFTGEEVMLKAKPASVQVRVRPLKKLKDMAN